MYINNSFSRDFKQKELTINRITVHSIITIDRVYLDRLCGPKTLTGICLFVSKE